jgi:NADH:ubiquinone reductase (H+-translocating)
VVSEVLGQRYQTAYDSLIVAAGAGQSYFGNDHFVEFALGMKTIDDALEVRGHILGAFELAERSSDPTLREKLLTFTVIGAGPTGAELAGQIAELANRTLKGEFRHIDSTQARVILLDAGGRRCWRQWVPTPEPRPRHDCRSWASRYSSALPLSMSTSTD